jgi:hypothetical protein
VAASVLAAVAACSSATGDEAHDVTVRLRLAGGRNIGSTLGKVYAYTGTQGIRRVAATPQAGSACTMSQTPETTCTVEILPGEVVTLIAVEPDPAVFVRLEPRSTQDTVPDPRYVEFREWTGCPSATEAGVCVIEPGDNTTIDATFQLMQQVTVYQTGAARMDWIVNTTGPMLKVPAESDNLLDLAGCRRVLNPPAAPCDSVRLIGDEPWHRFTAYVPGGSVVGMFPVDGAGTQFLGWDGDCTLSGTYGGGVCSLITPEVSGDPILLTLRYQWWDCGGVPSDADLVGQGCVKMGGEPPEGRRASTGAR